MGLISDDYLNDPLTSPLRPDEKPLAEQQEEDFGFFDYAGDIAAAPFRGLAGAVEGIAEIGNIIPGVDYDIAANLGLGESETFVGGAIEGITEFATAFIPVAGWVGRGAKVAKMGKMAGGLEKAAKLKGAKGWAARRGQEAIAGGIADFAVIQGHEARLSDLIEQFPALQNPVTEFLQSDEDDSEIVGRLKAAVEGIGAGVVFDSLLLGVKALRKGKGAFDETITKGGTEEAANKKAAEAIEEVHREADEAGAKAADKEGLWDTDIDFDSPAHEGEILVYVDPRKLADDHVRTDPQFKDAGDIPPTGGIQKRVDEGKPIYPAEFFHEDTPAGFRNGRHRILWAADQGLDSVPLITSKDSLPNLQKYLVDDTAGSGGKPPEVPPGQAADEAGGGIPEGDVADVLDERALQEKHGVEEIEPGKVNLRGVSGLLRPSLRAVENVMMPQVRKQVAASDDEMIAANLESVAEYMDLPAETVEKMIAGSKLSTLQTDEKVLFYKQFIEQYADEKLKPALDAVSKAVLEGNVSDEQILRASQEIASISGVLDEFTQLRAAQSQGLRLMADSELFTQLTKDESVMAAMKDNRESLIEELGGKKAVLEKITTIRQVMEAEGLGAAMKAIKKQRHNKWLLAFNEAFINNILSGGKSLVTNFLGPMMVSMYRPLETGLGALSKGDMKIARRSMREFTGLLTGFSDARRLAKMAWDNDELILDRTARQVDVPGSQRHAISARSLGFDENSMMGGMLDGLGKIWNIPTKFLGSTDEFVKQLNYRTVVRADLMEQGAAKGIPAGQPLAKFVEKEMDKMVINGAALTGRNLDRAAKEQGLKGIQKYNFIQKALKNGDLQDRQALATRALEVAREVTFTRQLKDSESGFRSLSRRGQMAVNAHPVLRPFVPFIRTPVNLLSFAGERMVDPATSGLRMLYGFRSPKELKAITKNRKRFIADLASNDPQRVAEARGRAIAGFGFSATGAMFAYSGNLTGGGPEDYKQKKILEQAGWQPYSIKIGDDYYSYQRADPFASMLGIFADFGDICRYAPPEMDAELADYGFTLGISFARNIGSKTYLQGLMDLTGLMQEPERYVEKTGLKLVGSSVMFSGLLGQSVQAVGGDESMREIRTWTDAIKAKIPFLSQELDAQRNFMGEPSERYMSLGGRWTDWWLPVMHSTTSSDPINRELAGLGHAFSPPTSNRYNVDMRSIKGTSGQSAYDRWMELHQEVRIGGRSLNQAMNRLIRSSGYRRLSPEGFGDEGSPRVREINKLVGKYRSKAESQLWREFPEVHAARKNKMVTRRALRTGQTTESIRASLFPLD